MSTDTPQPKILWSADKTMRDEFAMAALSGMLSKPVKRTFTNAAVDAYRYADAMLEARNANR